MFPFPLNTLRDDYRHQLDSWTHRMAVGDIPVTGTESVQEGAADGVREFIDGNVEKRIAKLTTSAGCLRGFCPAWEGWTAEFVRSNPPPAYATAVSDCLGLLRWIRSHADLTPEQRDALEGQRSRLIVEQRVRRDRAGYLKFSRRFRESQDQEIRWNEHTEILLNPSCTPALFRTRLFLDEHAEIPARVFSYAVDGAVHTTVLQGTAARIVAALCPRRRATVESLLLAAMDGSERVAESDVVEALEELVQSGIAALIPGLELHCESALPPRFPWSGIPWPDEN